jgi:hypothetical protein
MAVRLRDASAAADATPQPLDASGERWSDSQEEAPGFLDRIAAAESALPRWNENIVTIGSIVEDIGDAISRSSREIDALGTTFSARVGVAGRLGHSLAPRADRLLDESNQFVSNLHDVDDGFRTMINMAPAAVEADPGNRDGVCSFFSSVRTLASAADRGLGAMQSLSESSAQLDDLSRELRPPLRRLREGLQRLIEARALILDWVALIDATNVSCDQPVVTNQRRPRSSRRNAESRSN